MPVVSNYAMRTMTMILFLEDWNKYPNAIADVNTKNKSFIKTSAVIKAMKVKNHTFMLALHNPNLRDIDPHSENLTSEEKLMVTAECYVNYWYAIREVHRVPVSGDDPIPYIANRANICISWLFFNHITVILIQIRQTGKTVSTNVLNSYLLSIRCRKTTIGLLTKDDKLRTKTVTAVKDTINALPSYLCQMDKRDVFNTESLGIRSLGNTYQAWVPQSTETAALKTARGFSIGIWHIDEPNFQRYIAKSMSAALASGTRVRPDAAARGNPYGTILTTTAGKLDDPDGMYIYGLIQESATWTETYYDCENEQALVKRVEKNGLGNLNVFCEFNHKQLGYSDEWLRKTIRDNMVKGEDADRDFFNIWTSGSELNPLDPVLLAKIQKSSREADYVEISRANDETYDIRWYIPEHAINYEMNKYPHIISLDGSEAVGKDDIGIVISNLYTGKIVAVSNLNEHNLILFSDWFAKLFLRFPKLICIPERRNSGVYIIDNLILILVSMNIDPFTRIFNRVVNEPEDYPELVNELKKPVKQRDQSIYRKYKKVFGWATSGGGVTSRSKLYTDTLTHMAEKLHNFIYDSKLVHQILSLVTKNNRIDHPPGGHDDLVICAMLNFWFMTKARNLYKYGLDPLQMLAGCDDIISKEEMENLSPNEIRKKKISQFNTIQSQNTKNELAELAERYREEKDSIMKNKIKRQMMVLIHDNSSYGSEPINLDALLNVKKEKKYL